jgi:hypothetical protein
MIAGAQLPVPLHTGARIADAMQTVAPHVVPAG